MMKLFHDMGLCWTSFLFAPGAQQLLIMFTEPFFTVRARNEPFSFKLLTDLRSVYVNLPKHVESFVISCMDLKFLHTKPSEDVNWA